MRISSWKKRPKIEIIPLSMAMACEDCHNVTKSKNAICSCCGSLAVWPLVAVLERMKVNQIVEKILRI